MDEKYEYSWITMLERENIDSLYEEPPYRGALYTKDGTGADGAIPTELIVYLADIIEAHLDPTEYRETYQSRRFITDFRQLALHIVENADMIAYTYGVFEGSYICHLEEGVIEYDIAIKADKDLEPVDNTEIDLTVLDPVTHRHEGIFMFSDKDYDGDRTFDFNHYWPYRK